jgi:signal transduction histidine kinase
MDHHLAERASSEASRLRAYVAELEATKAALEQTSQRLLTALTAADAANSAKSRFLAAMSHELRTPLNAVIGFSEMMGMEAFGPLGHSNYKEYVRDIHTGGTRLLTLINDILVLSKLDAGETLNDGAIVIEGVVNDALRVIVPQAERARIRLSADIEPDLSDLKGNERSIKQILLSLLSNAVKFSHAGGSVRVRAWQDDEGIAIAIADDGIGIAPQDIEKAMEPFEQVDSALSRKFEGAGLGLPLAKQLAEMHGGTLALESELHKGTIVTVRFPASRIIPRQDVAA